MDPDHLALLDASCSGTTLFSTNGLKFLKSNVISALSRVYINSNNFYIFK